MSKIMLVEDDTNLLEIYQARLAAEGFQIITAKDGEEALAIAVKERPDLIIADIMMPKVSGFDMLDILRGTQETKNVKIIMMTALSQIEDKQRAEKLGADRYLVKSQVTLEDVVRVAKEVLAGQKTTTISGIPVEQPEPPAPNSATISTSLTAGVPSTNVTTQTATVATITEPSSQPATNAPTANPATLPVDMNAANQAPTQEAPVQKIPVITEKREHKVIEPSPDFTTARPNIDSLLAQESTTPAATVAPPFNSVIQPSQSVGVNTLNTTTTSQASPTPTTTTPPAGTVIEPVLSTQFNPATSTPTPTNSAQAPSAHNQLIQ